MIFDVMANVLVKKMKRKMISMSVNDLLLGKNFGLIGSKDRRTLLK